MARRRVNTQFLITAFLITGAVVVVGYLGLRVFIKDDWRQIMRMGDLKLEENDPAGAALDYGRAAGTAREQADKLALMMKQAEAYYAASALDRENYLNTKRTLVGALDLDPEYKPALKRMLELSQEDVNTGNMRAALDDVREYAGRLLRLDPADLKLEAVIPSSIVQGWLAEIPTETFKVDQAIKDIEALQVKDPTNSELPLLLTMCRIRQARDLERSPGHEQDARKVRDDCVKMIDAVFDARKQDAPMQLRLANAYSALASAERDPEQKKKLQQRMREAVDWARAAAQPTEPLYVDIQMQAARFAAADQDMSKAKEILRKLRADYPNEPRVLIQLARTLAATRDSQERQEAISILAGAPDFALRGARGLVVRQIEGEITGQLLLLRIDAMNNEQDPKAKEEIRQTAQADYDKLTRRLGETYRILKLRGKLEMASGRYVDAVRTFERAAGDLGIDQKDPELLLDLAQANQRTNQSGRTRQLLTELLKIQPDEIGPRLFLVDLLLRETVPASEIESHLRELDRQLPNDPRVVRMRLRLAIRQNDKDASRKYYDQLPEASRDERLIKAQDAVAMGDLDAAIVLLEKVHAESPAHPTVRQLAAMYEQKEQVDRARKVVEEAIAADPTNIDLKLLREQFEDRSPEQLMDKRRELILAIEDEYTRESQLASLASEQGKPEEAIAHLKKAETLRPDELTVKAELFQAYLSTKQFDLARQCMEPLVKANMDQASGLLYQFYVADAQDNNDEAMRLARQLQKDRPEFARSYQLYGRILQKMGQPADAIPQYMQALSRQRENPEALRGVIECYYALNNTEQAWRYIRQARSLQPRVGLFREMELNHVLRYLPNPEDAVKVRELMLARAGGNPRTWMTFIESCQTAASRIKSRNPDLAAALLAKGADASRQAREKWPDEADFYIRLANIQLEIGKPAEGERTLEELLQREAWKSRPAAWLAMAEYCGRSGAVARAEEPLRKAAALAGNPPELLKRLASYLAGQGRVDEALGILDLNPKDAGLAVHRVNILAAAGRMQQAEQLLSQIIQQFPNSPDLIAMMAEVWANSGRFTEAIDLCAKVLAVDPRHVRALTCRAVSLIRQARPDPSGAITDLRKLRELSPNDPNIRLQLAEAFRMRRNYDLAARELEFLMDNGWGQKDVRVKLLETYLDAARWLDAQKLLDGARAQSADDPEWAQRQAILYVRKMPSAPAAERPKLAESALAAMRDALKMAPRNPGLVRGYLDILLQLGDNESVIRESKFYQDQKLLDWWLPCYRARALAKQKNTPAAAAAYQEAFAVAAKGAADARSPEQEYASRYAMEQITRYVAMDIGVKEAIALFGSRMTDDARWQVTALDLYRLKGDDAGAIALLDDILPKLSSQSAMIRMRLLALAGSIYMTAKPPQVEKSLAVYRQILAEEPNNIEALNNIAMLLVDLVQPPQFAEALKYSQQAYDLVKKQGVENVIIKDTHAWVLVKLGRTDEAVVLLKSLLDHTPFPEGYYHLAAACLQRGQPAEALRQLDTLNHLIARHNWPIDQELSEKLDKLSRTAKEMAEMRKAATDSTRSP